MSRGLAWYNATRLNDPPSAADARESTARSVQEFVQQVSNSPIWTTHAALRVGRFIVGLTRRWPNDPELAA
jgi:hypothetical protein